MNYQKYFFYLTRWLLLTCVLILGFLITVRASVTDFDGDGKTDISVFRPSDGYWHIMKSSGGGLSVKWGLGTDALVPGDYDGDGKTDVAVFRPSNGVWYLQQSIGGFRAEPFGFSNDVPLPNVFVR